jgi:hypothetical protein
VTGGALLAAYAVAAGLGAPAALCRNWARRIIDRGYLVQDPPENGRLEVNMVHVADGTAIGKVVLDFSRAAAWSLAAERGSGLRSSVAGEP